GGGRERVRRGYGPEAVVAIAVHVRPRVGAVLVAETDPAVVQWGTAQVAYHSRQRHVRRKHDKVECAPGRDLNPADACDPLDGLVVGHNGDVVAAGCHRDGVPAGGSGAAGPGCGPRTVNRRAWASGLRAAA